MPPPLSPPLSLSPYLPPSLPPFPYKTKEDGSIAILALPSPSYAIHGWIITWSGFQAASLYRRYCFPSPSPVIQLIIKREEGVVGETGRQQQQHHPPPSSDKRLGNAGEL